MISYGCQHSPALRGRFFSHCEPVGFDLGNVELKESRNKWHKFILKEGDHNADYVVFYDHKEDEFNIIEKREMPIIRFKRAMSLNQVRSLSYFTSTNPETFREEMERIVKDTKYLAWIIDSDKSIDIPTDLQIEE